MQQSATRGGLSGQAKSFQQAGRRSGFLSTVDCKTPLNLCNAFLQA